MRFDMLDYPTAWEIQARGVDHTTDKCSAVQSDGAFLCDCGAVEAEWERLRGVPFPAGRVVARHADLHGRYGD